MRNFGRCLAVLVGLMAGAFMFSSQAVAGDYVVKECFWGTNVTDPSTYVESPSGSGFAPAFNCPAGANNIIATGATNPGDQASIRYEAPSGTGFLGSIFWYGRQSSNGVSARYVFNNAGGADTEVVSGLLPEGTGWAGDHWIYLSDGQPRTIFRATLKCDRPVNPCGTGAYATLQNLEFKMRDSVAPTAYFLGGTLFDSGTVSGTRTAYLGGIDNGSGVSVISINVNDALVNWTLSTCNRAGMSPCPRDPTTTFNVNTAGSNFVNGVNKISVCVQDYATTGSTNATCEHRYINVAK